MRLHAIFPQTEIGTDPLVIARFIREVEAMGCDGLVAYDHVLGADPGRSGWSGPYTIESTFHEVMVLFSYAAAITTRLQLSTGVLILPQRQTALVAKQAAALDVLSGGRLRLGVGVGWNWVEFDALGMSFKDRGKRIEEQIALLRKLWTEPSVTFEGRWHHVDRAGINPLPIQRPIPLWMGADSEPAIRRVARLADGFFAHFAPTDEGATEAATFWEWVREAGRDPKDVGLECRMGARMTDDELARAAERFRAMGATDFECNTMRAGFRSPDEHLAAYRRFMERVTA
ncbi:MAG TPA: LLM class F420-dependent oxidoreductase [Candidatus Limnocylindria bacterium]|nr:LLM class F420-dependent oxidoreductase [Candidatus Limnocylindria bacterium]